MAKINKHLDHLEDRIILDGKEGAKDALRVLKEMGEMFSGKPGVPIMVTTKWDGAPAVVCGIDPEDGRFFVGTKSVFAKEPKLMKTQSDIQLNYSGGLAAKLSAALRYLPNSVKSGVLQGDLMFTDDKTTKVIDGQRLITFRPNTITYAAVPNTPLGRDIANAKIGIVFHTKYTGDNMKEMQASFRIEDTDFTTGGEVWAEKAEFKDISGLASFTMPEREKYNAQIRMAEGSLRQSCNILNEIQSGKRTLELDTEFLKFFNNYVKEGRDIPSVAKAYEEFRLWMNEQFNKEFGKAKTNKTVKRKSEAWAKAIFFIMKNEKQMKMLIASYMNLQAAKMTLVAKLKRVSSLRLFVDKGGGDYEVTTPEGFVAITNDQATKLIDRLEFSRLNFTVPKVW